MPSLAPITDHVAPFLLVLFRLSGLLVFAPLLASAMIPAKIRVLLCLVFALSVYPTLPAEQMQPISTDLFSLAPMIVGETLIGLALGLMAAIPIFMVQLGGFLIGQQAGLTLGVVFNPAMETEADALGQLLMYSSIVVFISLGGLESLFLACARSFAGVPIGAVLGIGAAALSPLDLIVHLCTSGFELALRVSAPVLCIIMIETVVGALIMKTMPQLNIMSIGFAVKIVLTLLAMAAAAATLVQVMGDDHSDTMGSLFRFVEDLAARPPAATSTPAP